jgi:hypothetical protein
MSPSPQNQYVMLVFLAAALALPAIGATAMASPTDATQNIAINLCTTRLPAIDFERVEVDAPVAKTFQFMFLPKFTHDE